MSVKKLFWSYGSQNTLFCFSSFDFSSVAGLAPLLLHKAPNFSSEKCVDLVALLITITWLLFLLTPKSTEAAASVAWPQNGASDLTYGEESRVTEIKMHSVLKMFAERCYRVLSIIPARKSLPL